MWRGWPAKAAPRSLSRNGTPLKGPSGRSPAAASRPSSYSLWMTALISPLEASMRSIAASTSSSGLASLFRTSSAWAVASSRARSLAHGRRLYPLPDRCAGGFIALRASGSRILAGSIAASLVRAVLDRREAEALMTLEGGDVDPLRGIARGQGVGVREGVRPEHRGVDEAGEHSGERDAARLQLSPRGLGDRREGGLAAAVGGLIGQADEARQARRSPLRARGHARPSPARGGRAAPSSRARSP